MNMKLKCAFAAVVGMFAAMPLFGAGDPFVAVYDTFSPSDTTKTIHIWLDGETQKGRVSFLMGKNPLVAKKADGSPVVNVADEKCKVEFCRLNYNGGEDNRAFKLYGYVSVEKDVFKKVYISFIPRRDGFVRLSVGHWGMTWQWHDTKPERTRYEYPDFGFARYAKFSATNTKLNDPMLSKPAAWGAGEKFQWFPKNVKSEVITEKNAPVSKSLRTFRDISQVIPVKKEKEVVISFYVCGDDRFKSKK